MFTSVPGNLGQKRLLAVLFAIGYLNPCPFEIRLLWEL